MPIAIADDSQVTRVVYDDNMGQTQTPGAPRDCTFTGPDQVREALDAIDSLIATEPDVWADAGLRIETRLRDEIRDRVAYCTQRRAQDLGGEETVFQRAVLEYGESAVVLIWSSDPVPAGMHIVGRVAAHRTGPAYRVALPT